MYTEVIGTNAREGAPAHTGIQYFFLDFLKFYSHVLNKYLILEKNLH